MAKFSPAVFFCHVAFCVVFFVALFSICSLFFVFLSCWLPCAFLCLFFMLVRAVLCVYVVVPSIGPILVVAVCYCIFLFFGACTNLITVVVPGTLLYESTTLK